MSDDVETEEIRDPSKEGWLSDICNMDAEKLVTCSGVRKLPGRPTEYANGEAIYFTREDYKVFAEAVTGTRLDPCTMWREMGHDIECEDG